MGEFVCGIEIERKYIIRMPRIESLAPMEGYGSDRIVQTYLESPKGVTHRVRSREGTLGTRYYETKKERIDAMSSVESEREIEREEYEALLSKIAVGTSPITKTRHSFTYLGQLFEIDVYPEWQRTAILETELRAREAAPAFPPFIEVVREVTGNVGYSNAAMARSFPGEDEV